MSMSVTEFESLSQSFVENKRSAATARWERKKARPVESRTLEGSRRAFGSNNGHGDDRYIPNRSKMNLKRAQFNMKTEANAHVTTTDATDEVPSEMDQEAETYKEALGDALLGSEGSRVLAFNNKAPEPKGDILNNLNVLYSNTMNAADRKKSNTKLVSRQIPSAPSRILDAPDMIDDYYLNLLSWSDTDVLAVALSQTVYLWNAGTGDITELCNVEGSADAHVSAVSWVQEGGCHLAVGTSDGTTQLWDVQACKQLRSMDGHSARVGALSWNAHILSSGGRDALIVNHDVRIARHKIAALTGHSQEVCQLAWSPDAMTLASGANDNKLCLWDASTSSTAVPRFELTDHQAAVKALAWSPHERHLLASGGGTADRCIKFWNAQTGSLLNSIDTASQVCALQWNPFEKEILSSHGFARNHLCLWKYPSMAKVKELEGHTARVLHMALSPDGGSVCSAAADETLRFWDVFAPPASSKNKGASGGGMTQYRSDLPMSTEFLRSLQIR